RQWSRAKQTPAMNCRSTWPFPIRRAKPCSRRASRCGCHRNDATDVEPGTLLLACAIHSFGFALFHLGFWGLFGWPRTLAGTTRANRAILQIANLQLVWVFTAVGLLCLLYPAELATTPP